MKFELLDQHKDLITYLPEDPNLQKGSSVIIQNEDWSVMHVEYHLETNTKKYVLALRDIKMKEI